MGKDRKKKGKEPRGAAVPQLDGQAPRLDAKLTKVVAKRMKKLRVELAEATRREGKKVRALDKAHRRRQLIQAAIDELSMDLTPTPAPAAASAAPAVSRRPQARAAAKPAVKAVTPPRSRRPAPPKP